MQEIIIGIYLFKIPLVEKILEVFTILFFAHSTGILLYVHQINQPQNHLGQIAFQDQAKWKYMTLETCTLQKIISSTPKSTVTHTKKDAVPISSSSIFRWTATPEELSLNGLVVHGAIATTDQGVLKWQHLNYFGMAPIPRSGNVSASTTSVSSPDLAFSNDTIPSNTISTNVTISDLSNNSSTTAAAYPTSTRTSYAGKDSMMGGVILASTLVLLFN
jgi:hypothetical protein